MKIYMYMTNANSICMKTYSGLKKKKNLKDIYCLLLLIIPIPFLQVLRNQHLTAGVKSLSLTHVIVLVKSVLSTGKVKQVSYIIK